jgi:hypothetical protein
VGANVKPDDDTSSSISEGVVHMTITITSLADAGDVEMNQIQDQLDRLGGRYERQSASVARRTVPSEHE